jgi:hypothetical protein
MLSVLAMIVVVLVGLYFAGLSVVSLAAPARASSFLMGFASSASAHYAELLLRLVVGAAFVLAAPRVPLPGLFTIFGWLLIGTTAALFLVPWHWHRRFAQRVVPVALRYLPVVTVVSMAMGSFILWSAIRVSDRVDR